MSTATKKKPRHVKLLERLGACSEAIKYADNFDIAQEAWDECDHGEWMLWIAAKTQDRKLVVRAACLCAGLALKHVPAGEDRPRKAIETAEAWTEGKATINEVRDAANAAANAAAICCQGCWSNRTSPDGDAAANAAADAAANAAPYAAAAAARAKTLKDCADIVRSFFPKASVFFRAVKVEATA